jgi:predicted RNase H-like HicB family nuclease
MRFRIETERETDGRWIAEIPNVPGAIAYGATEKEARKMVCAIALSVVATSPANTLNIAHPQSQ